MRIQRRWFSSEKPEAPDVTLHSARLTPGVLYDPFDLVSLLYVEVEPHDWLSGGAGSVP